jgi:ABC-type uncharacterized transport system substrate-binding protein
MTARTPAKPETGRRAMRGGRRFVFRCGVAAALAVSSAGAVAPGAALAEADADVAIYATLTVKFDDRGQFAAVGQTWTFGYDYSAMIRRRIDADGNGTLDRTELDSALHDTLAWIADAGYLTRISEGGQRLAQRAAEDISVAFPDGRLVVGFTLPLREAPRLAIQEIQVSDPEFFYVVQYGLPDVVTEGAPDFCSVTRRSITGSAIDVEVRCR